MSTIGVFSTVSCEDGDIVCHTFANIVRHPAVTSLAVIHTGSKPPTKFGHLAASSPKVYEEHRDFGSGLDRAIEAGGFNQISARHYAQGLAELSQPDWLVRLDADEIMLDSALDLIAATDDRHDLIGFDYHTLLPQGRFWYEPRIERQVAGNRLLDPHLAVWRRALSLRDELCPVSAERFANASRHCNIRTGHIPAFRVRTASGLYHLHLHCLMGKTNSTTRFSGRPLDIPLAPEARSCLKALGLSEAWSSDEQITMGCNA